MISWSALLSLRWDVGVGFVLFWNGMFILGERLNVDCPANVEICNPLSKAIFFGTLALSASFFFAIVYSERFRRVVISPRRFADYDEKAFFAVAMILLTAIIAFGFFVR